MEVQSLEQLEERISKAVELMNQFRTMNQELQHQNKELLAKLEECERDCTRLKSENDELRHAQQQSELSAVQQEEIKKKIEGMLSKLEDI
jgi:FtsZ-binding cell division protein ZapB